jgi:hypothetical protein
VPGQSFVPAIEDFVTENQPFIFFFLKIRAIKSRKIQDSVMEFFIKKYPQRNPFGAIPKLINKTLIQTKTDLSKPAFY